MDVSVGRIVHYWPADTDGAPSAALVIKVNRGLHGETLETVDLQVFRPDGKVLHVERVHGPDSDLERNNARERWTWPERV